MQSSDQEEPDQRRSPGMEDNTAMTVEFLRARLLSERSVSRAARQRADELANRVAELEEQLKTLSIQRKKAEKATEDLLEILNNHGITDASEAYTSSSEQEQEADSSDNSNVRRNDSERHSGSELDSSSGTGRSLSWKGRKNSPHSLEKHKLSVRRGSSFPSFGSSSSRHRQGKSCRQIRRRELRSVDQVSNSVSAKDDDQENGVAMPSEGLQTMSDIGSENTGEQESELQGQRSVTRGSEYDYLEDQRTAASSQPGFSSYGRDEKMKEALEHQVQLIGQYEAMEKAQREWEEKFRENDNITPESCDVGNQSDITEERDDCKERYSQHSVTVLSQSQHAKAEVEGVCMHKKPSNIEPDGYQQPSRVTSNRSQDQKSGKELVGTSSMQENRDRNMLQTAAPNIRHDLSTRDSTGNKLATMSPSPVGSASAKVDSFGSKNDLYALVPHETPRQLSGVLDALKEAKLSLQQQITKSEIRQGGPVGKIVETSVPAARTWDRTELPVGCAALFRIPTDYSADATSRVNFLGKASELSLTNYHPDMEVANRTGDRFITGTRSRFSGDDPLLGNEFLNTKPTVPPSFKPYLSSSLDIGLPSSSRYIYPSYPSVPDLTPQRSSNEHALRHPLEWAAGTRPADHFSFNSDQYRPNMYR